VIGPKLESSLSEARHMCMCVVAQLLLAMKMSSSYDTMLHHIFAVLLRFSY
jgi:hypothetical protein